MNQHLNTSEFLQCLARGVSSIAPEMQLHFASCLDCQDRLKQQMQIHESLSELKVQTASRDLSDLILNKLKKTQLPFINLNSLIAASLVLVALLLSLQLINPQKTTASREPLSSEIVQKIRDLAPTLMSLPQGISNLGSQLEIEKFVSAVSGPPLQLVIFICLICSLFFLVDQHLQRLFNKRPKAF